MPVSQIIRGGQNTFDDLGMVEMHGLWNLPVFQKAKDLVNLGLQHIQGNQDLKTKLIEAAPALVSYVAKKIPLLDLAEPELRDLAKDMATRLLESGTE